MFAWKPAPVQVTWLGYFATTGVPGIDYLLADPCSVPPGHESHFTETIWRLPETRYCFTPPAPCPGINALPAGEAGHLTFGSFGNTAKLNDDVVATWSAVLRSLPGARLLLKSRQLAEGANADHITARFARHGVPAGSLILEGQSPRADYLEAYQRVDIVLDTFPYPGGTTTLEALWMGVPVLTMRGDRLLARQGECLMRGAGLEAFVAQDANDFVARAVALAGQRRALADIRASLRERPFYSPLFDARRFSVHLEAALRGMWSRWCARSA